METPEEFSEYLKTQGYRTVFAPMLLKLDNPNDLSIIGLLFACRHEFSSEVYYYQPPARANLEEDKPKHSETSARPVIFAQTEKYNFATTHFTWNPDGSAECVAQAKALDTLLPFLNNRPPHILCGDMNIPRRESPYYTRLVANYHDAVPIEYTSSLDKNFHRTGKNPDLEHLFTSYMVDYLLTQPPYQAHNVRLEFGISDHAGIVAEIERR